MSILIKDMEMPHSCESCPCKTTDAFGGLGCQATGYIPLRKANQARPDNCPLVPVPPHGRLIDADALKASLAFAEKTAEWAVPALRAVLTVIDEMPTIIPVEEEES